MRYTDLPPEHSDGRSLFVKVGHGLCTGVDLTSYCAEQTFKTVSRPMSIAWRIAKNLGYAMAFYF